MVFSQLIQYIVHRNRRPDVKYNSRFGVNFWLNALQKMVQKIFSPKVHAVDFFSSTPDTVAVLTSPKTRCFKFLLDWPYSCLDYSLEGPRRWSSAMAYGQGRWYLSWHWRVGAHGGAEGRLIKKDIEASHTKVGPSCRIISCLMRWVRFHSGSRLHFLTAILRLVGAFTCAPRCICSLVVTSFIPLTVSIAGALWCSFFLTTRLVFMRWRGFFCYDTGINYYAPFFDIGLQVPSRETSCQTLPTLCWCWAEPFVWPLTHPKSQ